MKKKTVIVLACHRSGTKMVSECMNAGGILFGYKRLYGDDSYWSAPKYAKWIIEHGSVQEGKIRSPLLDMPDGGPNPVNKVGEYANFPDNLFIVETDDSSDYRISFLSNVVIGANNLKWERAEHLDIPDNGTEFMRIYRESLENLYNSIIEDYNSKAEFWGIKDPRTISAFRVWERVFKQFDNEIKLVFLYRSPMAVARGARHDITGTNEPHPDWPIERGLRMWKEHNSVMLDLMEKPYKKIVLKYEAFLEGDDEVERLDRFLGLGGKLVNPFDPNRQHQKSEEVPEDCREIWERLEEEREKSMQDVLAFI